MKAQPLSHLFRAITAPAFALFISACAGGPQVESSSSPSSSQVSVTSSELSSRSSSVASSDLQTSSAAISVSSSSSASSIAGIGVPIPGRIEAEDYVNFMDSTPGNTGEAYRQDDVDIQEKDGGGYNVGWVAGGEWLEYEFNNAQTGHYDIRFIVASDGGGGSLSVWLDGKKVGNTVLAPNTGGWQIWRDSYARFIEIPAGDHSLRIQIETGEFNIDAIELSVATLNPSDSFNVMSFNIRTADANDPGEGDWNTRRAEVVTTVNLYDPALLGVQEANDTQFNYLQSELGSSWSATNIRIMYRNDRFAFEAGGIIDLVDDIWGDRIAEWARMRRLSDNKTLIFLNTHWGVDGASQQGSAEILRDRLHEVNNNWEIPTVLLGDLNVEPGSGPLNTLLEAPLESFVAGGTFNGWSTNATRQLDYILGHKVAALSCEVITYREGNLPPSDHFPIACELLFEADQDSSEDVICVFDYDLTLSSHLCPATEGLAEYHCSTVGPTYGWTNQCLATAAEEAVQRCLSENAKMAVASHSPYDQAKVDALSHTGWPSDALILMQPGRNKAEMIAEIKAHYNLPSAKVIFWDDTSSNITAVAGVENIFAVEIDRGNPEGSNCGIQSHHIDQGWNQISH